MNLRERLVELTSLEELEDFLRKNPTCALFKAGACHKTMQGFGYVEEALHEREQIPMAFVRVIEYRPVSNKIAEMTGITHQSPQFILIVDGEPVYDVDNWNITSDALEKALTAHLGAVQVSKNNRQRLKHADTKRYKELLSRYVSGVIDDETFKNQWLLMFQSDSSLRSTQEFDLLNSLFGDVDKAIVQWKTSLHDLKIRAEQLLKKLEVL